MVRSSTHVEKLARYPSESTTLYPQEVEERYLACSCVPKSAMALKLDSLGSSTPNIAFVL